MRRRYVGQRLLRLAGRAAHSGSNRPGARQLAVQVQRPLGRLPGSGDLAGGQLHLGHSRPERGVVGRHAAGGLQLGDGLFPGTAAPEGFGIAAAGLGIDRAGIDRLGQQRLGLFLLAPIERHHSLLRQSPAIGQRPRHGPLPARQPAAGQQQRQRQTRLDGRIASRSILASPAAQGPKPLQSGREQFASIHRKPTKTRQTGPSRFSHPAFGPLALKDWPAFSG